jgi:Holin of 3TMs, for gene-transfer release
MPAFDPLTAIFGIGEKVIDRLWPDPAQATAAKIELYKMQQSGELAMLAADLELAKGQIAVNQVEAASDKLFVAGWRPFIGWTCGAAFAYKFVLAPAGAFAMAAAGHPIELPVLDFTEMSTILLGMLGLGGMRTIEKVKGVA